MKEIVLVLLMSCCSSAFLLSQELGKVFELGNQEKAYEALTTSYSQSLLEAVDNDIEQALDKWLDLMNRMEDYSERINYDIKGLRVWFHIFWAPDGTIDHIGYLMRDDSRNFDPVELAAFLKSFAAREKIDIKSNKQFSFYTGSTFPVYTERYSGN